MLAALHIRYREHRHDAVFRVEKGKDLRGALPGTHCKILFVRDKKGTNFLVVCLEGHRLDMKAVAGLLEAKRLSFDSPSQLRAQFGVGSGSATPFAAINDRPPRHRNDGNPHFEITAIVLDVDMIQANPLNYPPLINTATIALSSVNLPRFFDATAISP